MHIINVISFITFIYYSIEIEKKDVESYDLYKNEICSYAGTPYNNGTHIICTCRKEYTNEPDEEKQAYIRGNLVQCSYKRKKRFTTFFLAAFLPLGLDFFYLEYYVYFILILIFVIVLVVNHLICFFLSNKFKDDSIEEQRKTFRDKNQYKTENASLNNNIKNDEKEENEEDQYHLYKTINFILTILLVCLWVVDIIFQALGKIKDYNGVETVNDMNLLFSIKEE